MSVNVETIDEHTLLINYTGLIKPAEMLAAYTEIRDYNLIHPLHYILLYAVEAMYYEDELFAPEIVALKAEGISQERFKAIIVISILNQPLRQRLQTMLDEMGMAHKLFFARDRAAALDMIAAWES